MELLVGLDQWVTPSAEFWSDTLAPSASQTLLGTSLFGAIGLGGEWLAAVQIPLYFDHNNQIDSWHAGVGDLQLWGLWYQPFIRERSFIAAEIGLSLGTASVGSGMLPRGLEFLRDDQVLSPLGRRLLAASLFGLLSQEWGTPQLPWSLHLRGGVHFPSNHYPLLLKGGGAIKKELPGGWSLGSDLQYTTQWSERVRKPNEWSASLEWGGQLLYRNGSGWMAGAGVSRQLLCKSETWLQEKGRRVLFSPPDGFQWRVMVGWNFSLRTPPPPVYQQSIEKKKEELPADLSVREPEKLPVPFDEFEEWGANDHCDPKFISYGIGAECTPHEGATGTIRSGELRAIQFKPGTEEWGLEGYPLLDSLSQLMLQNRSAVLVFEIPMGDNRRLPSSVRHKLSSSDLVRRRGESLIHYMMARGVQRERLNWRALPGAGLVRLSVQSDQ